jgi:hypothetical protein
MNEVTRWLVIGYGFAAAAVFILIAAIIRRSPNGKGWEREPIMWALAWQGLVIGGLWVVFTWTDDDVSRQLSRVGVIAATLPVFVLAAGLMHQAWWPVIRRWWYARR